MSEKKEILLDIRSLFLIKEIFSYIYNKQGLTLIKNSKKYQKLFGIDITEYKKINGIYIIKGKYEIDKVYTLNGNNLIFKGQYINGKRKGLGTEYKKGKIIFKGNYLNEKKMEKEKNI